MATRKYSIDLVVQQQTTPPPPTPPPNPNNPPPGSQSYLDGLAKQATGIYAISKAWGMAKAAIDSYVESQEKLNEAQKTATERFLDFESRKRAFMYAAAGDDLAKRAEAGKDLDAFAARHPFKNPSEAINFAERWESDVSQYSKGARPNIDPRSERELREWTADYATRRGIPVEEAVGGMAGILGSTRWSEKYKDKAAANVKAKFARTAFIVAGGKGDPKTNWRTFRKLLNRSVVPDEEQSIVKGPEAIEEIAEEARIGAEFDPEQAETYMRNRDIFLRQFAKKSVGRALKGAGVDLTQNPNIAYANLAAQYVRLKESGKLPAGMTQGDYIQNVMKGNIRAAIGMQSTLAALSTGSPQAARAEARRMYTPENIDQATGAVSDAAADADAAAAGAAAEQRMAGAAGVPVNLISRIAGKLFQARGYGTKNDPRSAMEKGVYRSWNPLNMFGGTWTDWDDKNLVGDAPNLMAYQELVRRNMPGTARISTVGGDTTATPWWQEKGDQYWRADPNTRAQMMDEQIRAAGGMVKAVEILEKIYQEAVKQREKRAGIPQVPQAPGMIP